MSNYQTTLEQLKEVVLLLENYSEIPENQKDIFSNLIKDKLANAYGQLLLKNPNKVEYISEIEPFKMEDSEEIIGVDHLTQNNISTQQEEFRISKVHRMQKLKTQLKEAKQEMPDPIIIEKISEAEIEIGPVIKEEKIMDGSKWGFVVKFPDSTKSWFFADELESVA